LIEALYFQEIKAKAREGETKTEEVKPAE